jgi:hypothetical protein
VTVALPLPTDSRVGEAHVSLAGAGPKLRAPSVQVSPQVWVHGQVPSVPLVVAPRQQPNPSSHTVSQSLSVPSQTSAGGEQVTASEQATQARSPAVPQVVVHATSAPSHCSTPSRT